MKNGFMWVMSAMVSLMFCYLILDYFFFRNQGARFTARNGQELCERVQKLDGFPCDYKR